MKVLICGGRDLNRHECFNWLERNLLDYLSDATSCWQISIDCIIQGGAKGADQGAKDWAKSEGIKCLEYCADWGKHGRSAGPIRNRKMITEGRPDIVLALPGGKGTSNMIKQAHGAGVPVIEIERI